MDRAKITGLKTISQTVFGVGKNINWGAVQTLEQNQEVIDSTMISRQWVCDWYHDQDGVGSARDRQFDIPVGTGDILLMWPGLPIRPGQTVSVNLDIAGDTVDTYVGVVIVPGFAFPVPDLDVEDFFSDYDGDMSMGLHVISASSGFYEYNYKIRCPMKANEYTIAVLGYHNEASTAGPYCRAAYIWDMPGEY